MSNKALDYYLEPFVPFLEMNGVTEICINQAHEIYVERNHQFDRIERSKLDDNFLMTFASLIAEYNHQEFPTPLLSGSLPKGERIQFVMQPACDKPLVCSIRRHQMKHLTLKDYADQGSYNKLIKPNSFTDVDRELIQYYQQKDFVKFLYLAMLAKKNILISGGTGTGKTTFLNACLKTLPDTERIITIEDTREVQVHQLNAVHLLFNEEDERITSLNLFKACLRLRPDRILLSELRGKEAWAFLRAANSGHRGSLSTVHADTPDAAFQQLIFMMQQAGSTSREEQISAYIKSIINIIIQLERAADGMRVAEIYFDAINQS